MTAWLLDQLPAHMAEDPFLCKFLAIFTTIADGVRGHGDSMPYLLDVGLTPETMVRYLGGWIGLEVDAGMPVDHQRRIVGSSGAIVSGRGTAPGLVEFLELVTGSPVEVSDSGGVFPVGRAGAGDKHVCVRVTSRGTAVADHLIDLIADEIPADCTFDLWVGGEAIHAERRHAAEASR